jgi:ribosomal protein L19E
VKIDRYPESSRWLRATSELREKFRRRKDADELERLLQRVEYLAIQAGREWGLEEARRGKGPGGTH